MLNGLQSGRRIQTLDKSVRQQVYAKISPKSTEEFESLMQQCMTDEAMDVLEAYMRTRRLTGTIDSMGDSFTNSLEYECRITTVEMRRSAENVN